MRILAVFVGYHLSHGMSQKFVVWCSCIISWFCLVQKLTCQVDDMEQVINHNNIVLAVFWMHVIIWDFFVSSFIATIQGSLPNSIENKFAFF